MSQPSTKRLRPNEVVVAWDKTYRIIPSRYPPVDLFERIADPADWELLAAIEGITNPRLRDELGDIALVPPSERISGPGSSPIMAAFTHIGFPSRFSDGSYGVYYASDRFEGSLCEVAYHGANFLRRTNEPRTRLELRSYVGSLHSTLHDVRGGFREVHAPDSYVASQALGRTLRRKASNGVVFDGVRLAGSWNIAVFRPRALASKTGKAHVVQGAHLFLEWDGQRMSRYLILPQTTWRALPT